MSFNANQIAARELNLKLVGHRFLIEDAIRAGLLDGLPDDTLVVYDEKAEQLSPELAVQDGASAVNFQRWVPEKGLDPAWAGKGYFLHVDDREAVTLSAIIDSRVSLVLGKPREYHRP